MQNSPIGWVGGKRLLREKILAKFPIHDTYVEVFAGAAWVLFAKDASTSKAEVLNDSNKELTNFFRCVREKPLELMAALQFRLVNQHDFALEKEALDCGEASGSEVERAARFFWFIRSSFASKMAWGNFGYSLKQKPSFDSLKVKEIICKAHQRLRHVYIFSEDFENLIKRLDRPETLFYCDPPYYGCERVYPGNFSKEDHERLSEALTRIKGKFLLSYGDHAAIHDLYAWANMEEAQTTYIFNGRKRKCAKELLISNF